MLTCAFCSSDLRRALAVLCSCFLFVSACAPDTDAAPPGATPGSGANAGTLASGGATAGAGVGASAGMPASAPSAGTTSAGGAAPAANGGGAGARAAGAGMSGSAGTAAMGGTSAFVGGNSGAAGTPAAASGETGRMVGMTAAHNAVRARVTNPVPDPPLPPFTWSTELASIAQAYAEKLAAAGDCLDLVHSSDNELGENLSGSTGVMDTPKQVVDGWADEAKCYTFGVYKRSDKCDMTCTSDLNASGCGHYTQLVWRDTKEVGCGMATCGSGRDSGEVWVCNYKEGGNFVGEMPY